MTTAEQLALFLPVAEIKAVVDLLADLGLDPLHLNIDGRTPTEDRPNIRLWMRYRSDFERVCEALKAKPVERQAHYQGQRHWYAEADTDARRLLVQCVSLEHHPDWQPRPTKEKP